MSGVETAGLVVSIVSAFADIATLYQTWRAERRERRAEEANERLHELVSMSGLLIRRTYDKDFCRIGPLFAQGDEIGRVALLEQLVFAQEIVIAMLRDGGTGGIFRRSLLVQQRTLSGLKDQYQRLCESSPSLQREVLSSPKARLEPRAHGPHTTSSTKRKREQFDIYQDESSTDASSSKGGTEIHEEVAVLETENLNAATTTYISTPSPRKSIRLDAPFVHASMAEAGLLHVHANNNIDQKQRFHNCGAPTRSRLPTRSPNQLCPQRVPLRTLENGIDSLSLETPPPVHLK